MPSPFPGMDPWLEGEATFPSLHNSLIFLLMEALNATLPAGYVATTANRVWIDDETLREPDVSLLHQNGPSPAAGGVLAQAYTQAGMLTVRAERTREPWEEPFLEIRSHRGQRLVTAVEILSPSNKSPGKRGRSAYQQKQDEYWLAGVNLVEIDLLRRGPHTTAVPLSRFQQKAGNYDYHICITLGSDQDEYFVTPILLADPLPTLLIPLDPDTRPVEVALQPLFHRAYDSGRYSDLVDYSQPPEPPLNAEQHAWAAERLRSVGRPIPGGQ